MSQDVVNDPEFGGDAPRAKSRKGFRIIELMWVVGIIAVLVALVLPQRSRCCGWRMHQAACINKLKQISMALRSYADDYGGLPPAYTVDAAGRPLHSWRTLILPYLEQEEIYKKIDLSKPWDDPVNGEALRTVVAVYRCPEQEGMDNRTTYLGLVGPRACLVPGRARRLEEITDAHEATVVVIEVGEERAVPWMAPVDADESLVLGIGPKARLHHEGSMGVGFVDAHVASLGADTPVEVRRAMMTVSGNDDEMVKW
jgi:hypothetical protein